MFKIYRYSLLHVIFLMMLLSSASSVVMAEDGYRLWLRYEKNGKAELYRKQLQQVEIAPGADTDHVIMSELSRAIAGICGGEVRASADKLSSSGISVRIDTSPQMLALGDEGYKIYSEEKDGRPIVNIRSAGKAGLLYATFRFIRLLQDEADITGLQITDRPRISLRMLNQWDNLDGSIERGYSGHSIYKWDELPLVVDRRIEDFARTNASIGINAIAINNVNTDPRIIRDDYLPKVAAIADIFRQYNIKLYLSVNFASPLKPSSTPNTFKKWGGIGDLNTASPGDESVMKWWQGKISEIYKLIPDFGGFVVKANSEGMPGPQDYGYTHRDGANMLAKALQPYGGNLIWRAFVYDGDVDVDRAKRAYKEFKPLDGEFYENAFVQVKNGPMDFQPYEPYHPLFGAMPSTNMIAELQITQEYLGHSTYLVYLPEMWKSFLDSRIDRNLDIASLLSEQEHAKMGMAAVSNAGSDANWTGHHFAQANWYGYGRLAWNPSENIDDITNDWITATWTNDIGTKNKIKEMMLGSWQSFADLQTPFGLVVTTDVGSHYKAAFAHRVNKYWYADAQGIGYDRTATGTDYVGQYSATQRELFENIGTCPPGYLFFFHKVPWTHVLHNGRNIREQMMLDRCNAIKRINRNINLWKSLKNKVDNRRYAEVLIRLERQKEDTESFKTSAELFFDNIKSQ